MSFVAEPHRGGATVLAGIDSRENALTPDDWRILQEMGWALKRMEDPGRILKRGGVSLC